MTYRQTVVTAAIVLATASCGGTGTTHSGNDRTYNSHIELDQNTDPRIVVRRGSGEIADIWPAGTNVFVNGERVELGSPLDNFSYVTTGSDSAARINFYETDNSCEIEISEFVRGRLYGDTNQCNQEVRTEHSFSDAPPGNTEYHIGVFENTTVITVVAGSLTVRPLANPTETINIQEYNEATVTRDRIEQVTRLSEREVNSRINWRRNHEYRAGEEPREGMGILGTALIGIGAAIVAKEIYDRTRGDDDEPPTSTQPTDEGGNSRPDSSQPSSRPPQ